MPRSAFELDRLADLIADELQRQTAAGLDALGPAARYHDGHHDCATGECGADCDGAHCVAHCPDKVRRLVECGVERVSAGPGVGACDNVLARMIDKVFGGSPELLLTQLVRERDLSVDWRFISLRLINEHIDYDAHFPPEYEAGHTARLRLLRVWLPVSGSPRGRSPTVSCCSLSLALR